MDWGLFFGLLANALTIVGGVIMFRLKAKHELATTDQKYRWGNFEEKIKSLQKATRECLEREESQKKINLELTEKNEAIQKELDDLIGVVSQLSDSDIIGVIRVDSGGIIRYFDKGAKAILGYSQSDVIGRSFTMLMLEQDRTTNEDMFIRFAATHEQPRRDPIPVTALGKQGNKISITIELARWKEDGVEWFGAKIMRAKRA